MRVLGKGVRSLVLMACISRQHQHCTFVLATCQAVCQPVRKAAAPTSRLWLALLRLGHERLIHRSLRDNAGEQASNCRCCPCLASASRKPQLWLLLLQRGMLICLNHAPVPHICSSAQAPLCQTSTSSTLGVRR